MTKGKVRWPLVIYDIGILLFLDMMLLVFYRSNNGLSWSGVLLHSCITFAGIFAVRYFGSIYRQIWRYGGIQCYIRLLIVDGIAFLINLAVEMILPLFVRIEQITFARLLSLSCMNLLGALAIRMFYRYAFKCGT